MKILAIDTTTFLGSVALVEDDLLIASIQQGTQVTYSERLIHSIDHLLEGARWRKLDIDLIAVALGPGSFTGLRIGLGTAKGLAITLGKPMVGVSSLQVLACGSGSHDRMVVPVIDARRDEVYATAYNFKGGKLSGEAMPETVCPPDALCEKLKGLHGELVLVGDGARRYRELLKSCLGRRAIFPNDAVNFSHGAYLAQLARQKFEEQGGDDVADLVPNYIRKSDAEIGFGGRR